MPGLIGYTKSNVFDSGSFTRALNSLIYDESYKIDEVFEDNLIIASRAHLNVIGESTSPLLHANCMVWVEGEIYNLEELSEKFNTTLSNFPQALAESYTKGLLSEFCSHINGYFVALIYHIPTSELIIITDRYGLKPLYIYNKAGDVAWSSELKSFKFILKQAPAINAEVIDLFLELGYLTGAETWFKDILLADAATLYSFNLKEKTSTSERYWTWARIRPQNLRFDEAVDSLNAVIENSIISRTQGSAKLGVTLSGGVDSRVILSSVKSPCSVETLTWGIPNSVDVLLAKNVAKKKGCRHTFLELNCNSWYNGRELGVWKTDGMFNIMHMHSSQFHPLIKQKFDVNLNGFAGDLNIGGGWITNLNSRITEKVAWLKLSNGAAFVPVLDSFYDIDHEDPYFLDTRVRRFTNSGSIEHTKLVEQRKPFYDNNVMELVYGLPDEFRVGGKLYKSLIIKHLPELFENIHTTHSIVPLGRKDDFKFTLKRKIGNIPIKLRLRKEPVWKYHDYPTWIRDTKFAAYLIEMLDPKKAIYPAYTKRNLLKELVEPHLSGRQDYAEQVLAALTMELWFRKVL